MIYVIGDSHAHKFEHDKRFDIKTIGAITAYNLIEKNSTTNSNKKIFDIINSINIEKDSIVLVVGEIDCRIHIYYQYKKNNEKCTISKLIDKTINRYEKFLKILHEKNIKFHICGIPPAGHQENFYNYKWYATPEIHSKIYKEFNEKLKTCCDKNKYSYIDVYSKTVDENGFILKEYSSDNIHLNSKILPYMIEIIESKQRPTISTYITTINALFWQSTLEQTILQAALFSDEIVIVDSEHSSDGTQNLLINLKNKYPDKIKIYTFKEDYSKKWDTITEKKTFALKQCTSDYCILQDDDECIHEKYIEIIKQLPLQYPEALAFRFNTIHFYRSYDRYQINQGWYQKKIYMIKNVPEIKHGKVNDDPDNHVISLPVNNTIQTVPLDSLTNKEVIDIDVTSYHYGWCRNDAILLMKKYNQEIQWWGNDYWGQPTHIFPFKFDNPKNLPEFKGTHPTYMCDIIDDEENLNSMHIKEFEKESKIITPIEAYNIANETSKKYDDKMNEFIKLENHYNFSDADGNPDDNIINNIRISACIITRNESERIRDTILHVYPYVDEIIINDASDDDKTKNECLQKDYKFKIKYFKTEKTSNFAEERNKMHNWATGDYCLHIDTDERFDIEFLEKMRDIIQSYLKREILPLMFRFPRKNDELDITKDPDYQLRFVNRLYTKWKRNVHEIPVVIKKDLYNFNGKNINIVDVIPLYNYTIIHVTKDRTTIRKRWDDLLNLNRKLLICSMFKNSALWINDVLKCIDNFINYNNNVSNNVPNKLIINLAFLKSTSTIDKTNEILDKYIKSSNLNIWNHKFDVESTTMKRYEKLAWLRNYLITHSTENIKLEDDDLILFMDSDVKFDKDIINELIIDMEKCGADIIAPLICIEDNGAFKNDYFYDTLAFRNNYGDQFSHFKPYVYKLTKSDIKKIKDEKTRIAFEKMEILNELRRINNEFNLNKFTNNNIQNELYNNIIISTGLNTPLEVNSVGSFYLMKYKVAKNVKYTGEQDSEQVEFMNSARSKGYKIFVSQRLKVLHVNLEKYGLKWH